MNESIIKQWAGHAMTISPYPNNNFPPSLYYRFLKVLAMNIQPKLSVELGVCGGGGSMHLAMGWANGTVIGIDNQDDHKKNIDYIKSKYPNFIFEIADSIGIAKAINKRYGKVDILFIDTTHTYDQTMREYQAWIFHMAKDYIICFDDLLRPGMPQAWSDLPEPKLRLDYLHDGAENGGGFGVVWPSIK